MKEKIKKLFKNQKLISYIIIILVTIFTCIPLFSKYIDISVDDGIQHICRLIGTYDSLQEKNLFPVIMSGFCNGFGYSWNIFYSPLTAYLPLIFRIFTTSFVICLKLFMFSTMLLSGIFMYKLVYKISNSHKAGIISAIIYIIAPYHLTDLYSRVAIAELASFMFLPIVFIGMYNLLNNNQKTYYIAIGAIGLTLTHNVITIYTAIFCLIYLLVNYKKINKEIIKSILANILIILLCTSFYWIPLIEHYFATTYEVFVPNRMFKNSTVIESKLLFKELFITRPWDSNFHIGLPIIFGIVLTFAYRKIISIKYQKLISTFLAFGIASIIMTLKIFPFEYLPRILKMLQFPWRMMEFASFFLSIVSGVTISMFINRNNNKKLPLIIISIVYATILIASNIQKVEIPFNEEKYLEPINLNRVTSKIHPECASFEYLPQKAFKNMKYIKTRNQDAIILNGTATITNQNKTGTIMNFTIENTAQDTKIELPYIYYLGYSAKLMQQDGNIVNLEIKESENGFCMLELPNIEKGKVEINYNGTTLMKISYVLSAIGIILLACYVVGANN